MVGATVGNVTGSGCSRLDGAGRTAGSNASLEPPAVTRRVGTTAAQGAALQPHVEGRESERVEKAAGEIRRNGWGLRQGRPSRRGCLIGRFRREQRGLDIVHR